MKEYIGLESQKNICHKIARGKAKRALPALGKTIFFIACFLTLSSSIFSQNKCRLSGHLRDASSGESLIGATVFIKGTTIGTTSNNYGFYSLQIPCGSITVVFNYMGYNRVEKEIALHEDSRIDIELQPESIEIEEVVVTSKKAKPNGKHWGWVQQSPTPDSLPGRGPPFSKKSRPNWGGATDIWLYWRRNSCVTAVVKRSKLSDFYFPPAEPLIKVAAAFSANVSAFIYIVDRNTAFAASLEKVIDKPEKYIVGTYTTGEQLLSILKSRPFRRNEIHMVFLGYKLSDDERHNLMDGIETLNAIKAFRPDIEVVMLYNPDEASFGSYAKKNGAFDFIPKNDNALLRFNNIIWRIITTKGLQQKKRSYQITARIFVIFSLSVGIAATLYHFLT